MAGMKTRYRGFKFKVGVVEDNDQERRQFRELLKCRGYAVKTSRSARTAEPYIPMCHAVWLDMKLAGKTRGIEFAKSVNQQFPQMKIIIVTGHEDLKKEVEENGIPHDLIFKKPLKDPQYEDIYALLDESARQRTSQYKYLGTIKQALVKLNDEEATLLEKHQEFINAKKLVSKLWNEFSNHKIGSHQRAVIIQLRLAMSNFSIVPNEELELHYPDADHIDAFIKVIDILRRPNLIFSDEIEVEELLRNVGIETRLEIPDIGNFFDAV